ncbi:hypothetical protein LSTR_LSTR008358 [Laodelphax striatellus]|uniref:Uncharacterized protein n=1 Tax=Laodelphax striatellus TaxID=195883 RepID=A0A482XSU3_LAOST|nr:hypothetical protein LSTR_LSTR008358 [Laodelphax striatellus]
MIGKADVYAYVVKRVLYSEKGDPFTKEISFQVVQQLFSEIIHSKRGSVKWSRVACKTKRAAAAVSAAEGGRAACQITEVSLRVMDGGSGVEIPLAKGQRTRTLPLQQRAPTHHRHLPDKDKRSFPFQSPPRWYLEHFNRNRNDVGFFSGFLLTKSQAGAHTTVLEPHGAPTATGRPVFSPQPEMTRRAALLLFAPNHSPVSLSDMWQPKTVRHVFPTDCCLVQ